MSGPTAEDSFIACLLGRNVAYRISEKRSPRMQYPLRRITRIARTLEQGPLGVRRATPPHLPRERRVSRWSHHTERLDIARIPRLCPTYRAFTTCSPRQARRNTPQVTETSSQDTLLAAIESKVTEYQGAVKQVSFFTDTWRAEC